MCGLSGMVCARRCWVLVCFDWRCVLVGEVCWGVPIGYVYCVTEKEDRGRMDIPDGA